MCHEMVIGETFEILLKQYGRHEKCSLKVFYYQTEPRSNSFSVLKKVKTENKPPSKILTKVNEILKRE